MRYTFTLLATLALTACGGGSGGSNNTPSSGGVVILPEPPAPQRGSLVGSPAAVPIMVNGVAVNTLEPQQFKQMLDSAQYGASGITSTPVCAVSVQTVRYNTVGSAYEATEASAAVYLPSGTDPACTGSRPVLLYAHGTSPLKSYDMANLAGTEARLVAGIFAAQGFIVVAPNYAGYAGSSLPYHAYLDAEQQAADMIDGLRAARKAYAQVLGASKLYVTGYSQGGHVAVATQRAMQLRYPTEFSVAGAAGLSGPYALLKFGETMFGGAPTTGATAFLPMLTTAAQRANAGVYASSVDMYESRYANGIETLLPGTQSLGELASSGRLPEKALFAGNSVPQTAGFESFFGDNNLVRTAYRDSVTADMRNNPCNATAEAPLACAPVQPLRKWLLRNDLRSYGPTAPLLLCGGDSDPVVPFYNTTAAGDYYRAHKTGAALHVVNVDSTPGLGDDYAQVKLGFLAAKSAVRINAAVTGGSGDAAVRDAYHAGLVAPFCLRAARDFFRAR
ncbi:alpha/beta fold hydrolase [Duganella sp. FT92W]|uniref:Alpha/beta fold hydrolase n=1 Tax=Pseudoduganella rivuli TaxID=2666085 RepID=A0A7X2LSE2_9BURK|nr:lipase family protein [Pseudoduganella rivuli]MRV73425.1 alpha/beta fold hydrolase [Pseudoduganella rivuli]